MTSARQLVEQAAKRRFPLARLNVHVGVADTWLVSVYRWRAGGNTRTSGYEEKPEFWRAKLNTTAVSFTREPEETT